MAKRQIRFTGKGLASSELADKEVNVVMVDGVVHHVKILGLSNDHFVVEDSRKMIHKLPVNDIYEIILDMVSTY